ncbi:MAG: UbiD family decarboxylase [Pirellulales bacterium]|nr:UbiD family decarboxylase [Pirellulales bacterium]
MPVARLNDFLEQLAGQRQLVRVTQPVDGPGEVAALMAHMIASGGPALVFDAVAGSKWPVAANVLATEPRIAAALGVPDRAALSERVRQGLSAPREHLAPRQTRQAPCQQVARLGTDVDLTIWPFLRRGVEAAPAIHGALVVSSSPATGQVAVELADLAVAGPRELAGWWSPTRGVGLHLTEQRGRGPRLPVAIVLGGDPAHALAAAGWVDEIDPWRWAALIRGVPLELTPARTHALELPGDAELVIEGYLDPDEAPRQVPPIVAPDGVPYASCPVPVLHVTALTHRTQPMVPAMLPGPPPDERSAMQAFMSAARLEVLRTRTGAVADLLLPCWAGFERLVVVAVDKQHPAQGWQALHAAAAWEPLAEVAVLMAVDADVPCDNPAALWHAVGNQVDPAYDVHAWPRRLPQAEAGGAEKIVAQRLAIDATRKLPSERSGRRGPRTQPPAASHGALAERLRELGLAEFVSHGSAAPAPWSK